MQQCSAPKHLIGNMRGNASCINERKDELPVGIMFPIDAFLRLAHSPSHGGSV